MNDFSSTLIAHCGARKITREELMELPIPEATRTHQPLAHYQIIEVLEEALSFRYLKVERDEYAISQNGMKMFGVMDLNAEFSGCRFSIGLRNSNDKSMRLALTAGYRVFVCDNMAFSGDFSPLLHKHTRKLELYDAISVAVDRIQRGFEPLKRQVETMRDSVLTEEEVKLIIYRAFLDRSIKGIPRHLMPLVHDLYFHPQEEAFSPRNLWSLSNAFTSAFKKLAPVRQFETTARLGAYLSDVQENLKEKQDLYLSVLNKAQIVPFEQEKRLSAGAGAADGSNPSTSASSENQSVVADASDESGQSKNFDIDFENGFGHFAYGQDGIDDDGDFDEDDVADDPFGDEFDRYFDEEAASEAIDEAEEIMIEEYERRIAA